LLILFARSASGPPENIKMKHTKNKYFIYTAILNRFFDSVNVWKLERITRHVAPAASGLHDKSAAAEGRDVSTVTRVLGIPGNFLSLWSEPSLYLLGFQR
jgi:hypothetical protein